MDSRHSSSKLSFIGDPYVVARREANFDDCLWFHSFSLCDDEKLGSRQENSPDHLRPRDQTDQTGKTRIVDMRQRTHCGSRTKYNLAANEAED
jgi:hypothetical protein